MVSLLASSTETAHFDVEFCLEKNKPYTWAWPEFHLAYLLKGTAQTIQKHHACGF